MTLVDTMNAIRDAGYRFAIDVSPDTGSPWRVSIGDDQHGYTVELGAAPDLDAVDMFLKSQFPQVTF